ncbi:MAG: hypothetical protein ACP5SH_09780 [Syntrophobacteraceae bacterium]
MPIPAPKTKLNELLEQLNRLAHEGGTLTDMELQRFKREAQSVRRANPAEGYLLLGILAGFEGKAEDMHHFHKLAIQLSPGESYYLGNYMASLLNFRFLQEAVEFGREVYDGLPDNSAKRGVLESMIKAFDLMGQEEEFFKLCEEYEALTGETPPILNFDIRDDETSEAEAILSCDIDPKAAACDFVQIEDLLSRAAHLFEDARE